MPYGNKSVMCSEAAPNMWQLRAGLVPWRCLPGRKTDDIACSVNVRNVGLIVFVHFDLAARIGFQTASRKIDPIAVSLATDCINERIALNFFPAFEFRENSVALRIDSHSRYFFAQAECRPHLAQVVGQSLDDFTIHEV